KQQAYPWLRDRLPLLRRVPVSYRIAAAGVALVLTAALPSASNVSMLAERYGADTGRVARIILWTTVGAFLSFPLAMALLR
ncbi:hypothetical protein RSW37_25165, partial [Escherichia coli]|uniref:hypothetical protein n=1 Tax=Escherichia coli TaxID=562 RepID=UPI0028DFF3C6